MASFKSRVTGSEKAVTKPMKQGFPPVPKAGGINSPTTNGPQTAKKAAQYTAGKSQGGAEVLKQAATKPNAKIVKGGSGSMGREATSNDKAPGDDGNNGMVRHPQTHAGFESLGVPKGGKY